MMYSGDTPSTQLIPQLIQPLSMSLSLLGLQLYNVLWCHTQHPADTPVTTIMDVAVTVGVTALQCTLVTHPAPS